MSNRRHQVKQWADLPTKARSVRRVDLLANSQDFTAALMASMGFSTKAIQDETDLTPGQISYRLRMGHISRADYRNGTSVLARQMFIRQKAYATPIVRKELEHTLEENK
jgi:predicted metal-dependent HD superfamily phosphohydrolase